MEVRTITTSTRSQPVISSSPCTSTFLFAGDERRRLVGQAQKELVARAAGEFPDGSDELVGMCGLDFSDDEEDAPAKEEDEADDDEESESEENDQGDQESYMYLDTCGDLRTSRSTTNVPMSASEVSLYQSTADDLTQTGKKAAGTLSLNFFESVAQ